jgi:signal transduction histidine kinase
MIQKQSLLKLILISLKQVFINLIINSIQAIEKDGIISIYTRKRDKKNIQIEIHDTGKGIEESRYEEIFEFYVTSKKSGTGIGLALSKQIIEGHNGQIYIKSEVNKGTSFFIDLPVTQI